jgi:chromate transporter
MIPGIMARLGEERLAGGTTVIESEELERASLFDLFMTFLKIGVTSFGGASRPMMHRESVERRRWLREKDFLAGFAIAQVLPGANPVNLALYIGLRTRGALGATIAVLGMVVPAFCVILIMGIAYRGLTGYPATHMVLAGLAASGVAATFSTGIKMAIRLDRNLLTAVLMAGVFLVVGILHWPMVPVVIVAIPASFALAWFTDKGPKGGHKNG